METWSTRVRARGTLVVHWCAETTPNDCRVGDAARCLSSNPHHGAPSPPRSSIRVEGKMGGKVVRCMIGRLLDWYRSKGCFWFYLHCVDTLRTTGDFLMGQNNRWRRESMIIWKFIFFFFIIAFFICRVSCYEIFVLVQRPLFFVILINCSLVILSSFKLEVFRSNF